MRQKLDAQYPAWWERLPDKPYRHASCNALLAKIKIEHDILVGNNFPSSDKSEYCSATEHSLDLDAALIQRQLLSNIEQS